MKISINLLPPETVAEELKKSKFYKIQFIGVAVILVLVFLTSLTLALQILQSRNIASAQADLEVSQQRVSGLKSTQASLLLLKDRLTVINQYLGIPSKQSELYQLITKLAPAVVAINSISVSRNGEISFLALAPTSESLDDLLNNLIDKESNGGKISQVEVENLNRGRDGTYRMSLKIKSK